MANIADALKMRAHTYTLALKKVLKLLRGSKPGMAGLIIIMMFVVMAVFAPIIAPFGVDFIAPADDMFSVERIEKHYPSAEGFHPLVIGPTTPSESAMDGGMWFILANADGTIYMDFAVKSFDEPPTPFEDGNRTITLRIQDLNLEPPLSEVLFVAPGRGYNRTTDVTPTFGERMENGLLTFVANTTFVLLDPFVPRVLYLEDIGFMPDWFIEDTASAGDMLGPPSQKKIDFPFPMTYGPYRYIAIATEDRVIAYEFEYLWNSRGIRNLHMLVDYDVDITQEPLLYLFDNVKYTANASGLYVPSTNGTLYHFRTSTNGAPDSVINFTIDNQTAEFTAPIGFMRSSDAFPRLYLSLARENSYSYQIFDPLRLEVIGEFSREENARIELAPSPTIAGNSYIAVNNYLGTTLMNTTVYKISPTGELDDSFVGKMETVAASMFVVDQASLVFALGENGVLYTATTIITVDTPITERGMNELFFTGSTLANSPGTRVEYFGSFGGTKFGSTMNSIEMYNLFYNSQSSSVTLFQSIGTSLGALPPGTYPSGNTYYLGTDNVGHDILTLLIYGTRVALIVGLSAAFFSVVVGTLVGLISGYYGGYIDAMLMRVADIFLTLPFLPIVLIWSQIQGQSIWNIVIILAILGWPGIARVVRAQTLTLKERSFIDAARVSGSSDSKIILKHIAPNVLPFTFLYMTLFVAGAILTEAALSYLGLGDPRAVSWGNMLSTIQTSGHSLIAPWWLLPPGLAITVISLGFYLLGRGVDEIVNPRLRRR